MREWIRNMSSRGEFFLVVALSFGYFVVTSLTVLMSRRLTFVLTTGRVLRGIAIEVVILLVVGWILRVRGWRWRRVTDRISLTALLAGVPLFIGYYLLYAIVDWFAVLIYPAAQDLATVRMLPNAWWPAMLLFIVVNSVYEEAIVTGYVVSALADQGPALSITASAVLRFTYHLYQGPIASISILPLGFLFATLYFRWRNLWPLIVAHTVTNLIAFAFASLR